MEEFPARGARSVRPMAIDPLTGEPVAAKAAPTRSRGLLGQARVWRRLTLGLGLAVATLFGVTGRLLVSDLNQAAYSIPPHASATSTPKPSASATDTPAPSVSPAPSPSPSVSFLPDVAPPATVVFRDMVLESSTLSGAWARTFNFTSDGQGSVTAQVTASAPLDTIKMCVSENGQLPLCNQGATPGFKMPTPPGDHTEWTATIIALKANSTPIIDVAFTWPALSPSLTVTKARFQGYPNPESLRGFQVEVATRKAGELGLTASWGNVAAKASVFLIDENVAVDKALDVVTVTGTSFTPAYKHAVVAGHTYRVILSNRAGDKGRPNLTATITFP